MTPDYDRMMRTCARVLAMTHGVEPTEKRSMQAAANLHEYPSAEDRFQAWCIESLYSCAQALAANDVKLAFRCILQAREYMGRGGGFWPGPATSDIAAELQAALEDRVAP